LIWITRAAAGLAAVIIFIFGMLLPAESRVYIDISQPFLKKIPVAVTDFVPIVPGAESPAELSQGLPGRLGRNLDVTGMFVVLDKRTFLEGDARAGMGEASKINFREWLAIGSELLVKGAFSLIGDELTLELRLFDVFEGRMMLGKRYVGHKDTARLMINRFTNEILYLLTGEPGIFGTQIAFVGMSGGHKEIFLTEFGGEEAVQLTNNRDDSTWPVFSPDGGKIAYLTRRNRSYELRMLKLGAGEQILYSGEALHLTPCFTPSGGLMAAVSGKYDTNIFLLDPQGGKPVPVTNSWGINISPTLSPDGSQMAFVSNRAGGAQIYVAPANGGPARRLTMEGKENTDPQWSPRGDRIVFVGLSEGGEFNIYTINPDGSDLQQLTQGAGHNTRPTWSPDGRMITFASTRNGRSQIFTMSANGERQTPLLPDYKGVQFSPCWSQAKPERPR